MISNQILQNTIEGMKAISRVDMCLMDVEGKVLVSTFAEPVATGSEVMDFVESQADSQIIKDSSILRFMMNISWSMCWLSTAAMIFYDWQDGGVPD